MKMIAKPGTCITVLAAALSTIGLASAAQPVADDNVYQYDGPPVRAGATGTCVHNGFWKPGDIDRRCGAPVEAKQPAPVVQTEAKAAPPPAPAAAPIPEFVSEPEPKYIVPPPPVTEVRTDDGITQSTRYYDEDQAAAAGDGILGTKENPNYAADVAAAEAQMAQRPPPPAPPAPQPAPTVTAIAQPVPPAQPGHLTLDGEAYFAFNKHNLTPLGRERLDKLLGELERADYDAIVITGHTDRLGTDAYNNKLSEKRAQEVKRYLSQKGVNADKIQAKWVGSAEPVTAPGACDDLKRKAMIECLAPDRRVELEAVGMREK
jgi:outer membrane protein OmpA-like peptidoglycan-associated protein